MLQGQTHGKPGRSAAEGDGYPSPEGGVTSPFAPGSPLVYSPQMPMEPFAGRMDSYRAGVSHAEFAGWSAQPKVVPTILTWSHGGHHVELEGSWDDWSQRQAMQQTGKEFTLVKLLLPGIYQYKFIVDGMWRHDPALPSMFDDQGNVNNVLEVQEYVPEMLDSLAGFEPPPSPPASYNCPAPTADDTAKEPPTMPPQLQLSLLNVPPSLDPVAALPRPQHVILDHLYLQRAASGTTALVLGVTRRFRSKYITVVVYKPRRRRAAGAAEGLSAAAPASSASGARPASQRGGASAPMDMRGRSQGHPEVSSSAPPGDYQVPGF